MYLCVACVHIFYISMEMLACLCTSPSVCICVTLYLRHLIRVAHLRVHHCVFGQHVWECVYAPACV